MILFLDDEYRWVKEYIQELEYYKYDVHFHARVDDALDFFEQNADKIKLLILDIMMPDPGLFARDNTELGMKTGLVFYRRIRESAPDLPVIILTNWNRPEIEEEFRAEANCKYLQKKYYPPRELVEIVRNSLNEVPAIG